MLPQRPAYRRVLAPIVHRPTAWFSRVLPHEAGLTPIGVRSYSDERLRPGRLLEVDVLLRDGSTVTALAEVEWCDALPSDGPARFDVGMRIVQIEARAVPLLERVLERR